MIEKLKSGGKLKSVREKLKKWVEKIEKLMILVEKRINWKLGHVSKN